MAKKTIFLSYRRDDSPGYVSKLESELEQAFGENRVFRDVEDIEGGRDWKEAIRENLDSAAALILVIGPRWQQIWEARKDDEINYIAFELEHARQHGVRIIPVTLNGATLSADIDLGETGWVLAMQTYDISDKQGRWGTDVQGLVSLLEGVDGIGTAQAGKKSLPKKKGFPVMRWVFGGFIALIVLSLLVDDDPVTDDTPGPQVVDERDAPPQVDFGNENRDQFNAGPEHIAPTATPISPPAGQDSAPPQTFPDIAGNWVGADGTVYIVEQFENGTFAVVSPGYTNGAGRFIDGMPNKFEILMEGVGRGEFAVSTGGQRAIGWIEVNGQQEYDTLTRIE